MITGNSAVAETYRIYTRAAWDALAGNNGASLNATTEIVITRGANTDFATSVIAELREIEEIRINGIDPSGPGSAGGDTFQVIGDFSATSLRLNRSQLMVAPVTATIDISALTSAHRIVFRSNGGNDTIVGTLRPQDVIELPAGATADDYEITTDENGVTTMTSSQHSIRFTSEGGLPQFNGDGRLVKKIRQLPNRRHHPLLSSNGSHDRRHCRRRCAPRHGKRRNDRRIRRQ